MTGIKASKCISRAKWLHTEKFHLILLNLIQSDSISVRAFVKDTVHVKKPKVGLAVLATTLLQVMGFNKI